ncbi:hypothetical protein ABIF26_006426 [Bradyrhizobium elkanii]|uniref:hypothetical protein n=1 Tax=Bradyrhizobium elkanii TaxID=29448 RepID=UPI003515C0F7
MTITPKDWDGFQHYKKRSPIWIKLHRSLLNNYDFSRLPVASRALAPMLWLLASEYDGGVITASVEEVAFRFRTTRADLVDALSPLIESGFFSCDELLASSKQDASELLATCLPREERETETEKEKETDGGAEAPPMENIVPIRRYVFEGRVIRLSQEDYDKWRKVYSAIHDMRSALQSADDYYSENPPRDGKWFFPVSRWLQKEHSRVVEEQERIRREARSF